MNRKTMDNPGEIRETFTGTYVVRVPPESRQLVALSPAELRLRSVYNHLTTFGVACVGMFVPLLAMLVVPSPCTPHFQAYLASAVVIGAIAVICLGFAFYGNRREDRLRTRQ